MRLNPYNTRILEPAVLDPNLESSLSATGRPVEGAKDVVSLVRVYIYSRIRSRWSICFVFSLVDDIARRIFAATTFERTDDNDSME